MYLIDTNVWLERLLDQQTLRRPAGFLTGRRRNISISLIFHATLSASPMTRLSTGKHGVKFVQDIFQEGAVGLVRLEPMDMTELVKIMERYKLDFDDAYQYLAAEKYRLTLVSFDSDFDRNRKGTSDSWSVNLTYYLAGGLITLQESNFPYSIVAAGTTPESMRQTLTGPISCHYASCPFFWRRAGKRSASRLQKMSKNNTMPNTYGPLLQMPMPHRRKQVGFEATRPVCPRRHQFFFCKWPEHSKLPGRL